MLTAVLILATPAALQAQFTFTTNNGTITITGYTGTGGVVVIPSTINGLPVTSIGYEAFQDSSITGVTIPNSVTNIGEAAFSYCYSLTDFTIPDSVTSIGVYAFFGCFSLTNITLGSGVTSIGDYAFSGAFGEAHLHGCPLINVTIPNSVTSIGAGAFAACFSLTNVTIGNSVTNIGDDAFFWCNNLTNITIPDSVTNIGVGAFARCSGLTNIMVDPLNSAFSSVDGVLFNHNQTTLVQYPAGKVGDYRIPNSVTSIADFAFFECYSLTSVTIPNSVTTIGDYAFAYCYSLTGVYFQGNAPSVGSSVFDGDNKATVYYLPRTMGWGPMFGGRPTVLLQPPSPVADASATQPVVISGNGIDAKVVLDGTRSFDPDGHPLQYRWFEVGSATWLADGVVAVVVLPVRMHLIDLVVSDGVAASTNRIVVAVLTNRRAVQRLISMVHGSGIAHPHPLTATLDAALASLSRGKVVAAANQLQAFQNKVQAQVEPQDQFLANTLTMAAQDVIDALGQR